MLLTVSLTKRKGQITKTDESKCMQPRPTSQGKNKNVKAHVIC